MKITGLFMRQRTHAEQEVREPTLLAFALTAAPLAILAALAIVLIVFLPAFGHIGWTFAAVALATAFLAASFFRRARPGSTPPTPRQKWFGRILGAGRIVLCGILTCWLGLIVWLALCPGGPEPPEKADESLIRVITWNIHCGQDEGWPWQQFDWPARKLALHAALDQAQPDILCVQEATPEQVAFLEKILPGHRRVGGGRDDGMDQGEHCAIFFPRQRFEELGSATFWLEEPIDQPRPGSALDIKRICTWIRLRDRASRRTFRVYNTHLYLTETPSLTAAKIILDQIDAGDPNDAVLLTADFNATPSAPSRRLFTEPGTGLTDSAARAGTPVGVHTFQLYGIGVWCIDGILVDSRWRVHHQRILDVKPHNTFPSDHFAILADVSLK